jgi:putative heme-binding domain-containing protein
MAFGALNPPVVEMPKVGLRTMQQRLQQAAKSAADMKLTSVASDLKRVMLDRSNDTDTRAAAAGALAAMKADDATAAMQEIVNSADEVMPLRTKVASALASAGATSAIIESFKAAPAELQTALAISLASNVQSATALLNAVEQNKAPARLLLDQGIHDRLAAAQVPDLDARLKKLTKGVFAPKQQVEQEITKRRAAFRAASHLDPDAGQKIFAKNCQVCHQIEGKGGQVGPNLAGLNKRGIDRLVEDVIDPNRNVDPAFHFSNVILKDGHLITGLQKKEEGEVLFFADQTGKEVQVKKSDIQQRIETKDSLMPSNFAEIIGPDDFNNLMAYLLSK